MKAIILGFTLDLALYVAVMSQTTTQSPGDCFRDATIALNSTDPECYSMFFDVFSVSPNKSVIHSNFNCSYNRKGPTVLPILKLKVFAPAVVQSR